MLTESQWNAILALGNTVEDSLQRQEIGLRMGGEPTFIALDHLHLPEWQTAALGEHKRQVAIAMLGQITDGLFPTGSVLLHGSGKLYPGEPYPRWALSFYWRTDGVALWTTPTFQGHSTPQEDRGVPNAEAFLKALAQFLELPTDLVIPAQEQESDPLTGYVLPLLATQGSEAWYWASCVWQSPQGRYGSKLPITLFPGRSPLGLRLPLQDMSWADPLAVELDTPLTAAQTLCKTAAQVLLDNTILVALTAEVRDGVLCIFLPPMVSTCSFADLIGAIDRTAQQLGLPVHLEGYGPPMNAGIDAFQITPDPGVIEVNVNPIDHWSALVTQTQALDQVAQRSGLATYKYTLDGRMLGTGGGAHITIGGASPQESPVLLRPALLRSIVTYWQHHPSLSYLFSGQFVGPTSQAPRVDEAHHEGLYELELAFQALDQFPSAPPALIDHLLRPLLTDLTGNTHRAALCIDKLYPVDKSQMQLGLLEFRAFEMPHHPQLRLLQLLMVRSLVAWFWDSPYQKPPIYFETDLQDKYFLPHFLQADWLTILEDLKTAGFDFDFEWFTPFFETRFPVYGQVTMTDEQEHPLTLELRHALELWPVLPEEATQGGTARPVDDSMDRIQVMLKTPSKHGVDLSRYRVLCQGQTVPLQPTELPQTAVAGVRFRAQQNRGIRHEAITPQPTLIFEVVELETGRSLGGCTYHVHRPDGTIYTTLPQSAEEASERLQERFIPHRPHSEPMKISPLQVHPKYPLTLDLRWTVDPVPEH